MGGSKGRHFPAKVDRQRTEAFGAPGVMRDVAGDDSFGDLSIAVKWVSKPWLMMVGSMIIHS